MTNTATNSEQAVAALFSERQRYEAWLAALEEKRGSTPAHIYERVHADYVARLQHVEEELGSQRAALQELEGTLLQRLTALDVEEARHQDEAAEAELRAAVGELTAAQHQEVAERTSAALAALREERDTITPQLTRLRAVLEAGAEPAPAPAPPEPEAPAGAFDELTFLKSLVESRLDGSGANPRGRTDVPPSGKRETIATGAARPGAGRGPNGEGSPASAERNRTTTGAADAPPSYLKDVKPEQVKTLKCQECGTLNYPTEWYCERCGAELAAL